MISLCRYILQGGAACRQAAIKGEHYCRHHLVVRRTVKGARGLDAYGMSMADLPLVFPEDHAAIQANLFVVMQALSRQRIGVPTANALNRLLKTCAENLKAGALAAGDGAADEATDSQVRSVVVMPGGEEMAPVREVLEEGEAHGEACLCRQCAVEHRGVEMERHDETCQCGECAGQQVSESASQQVSGSARLASGEEITRGDGDVGNDGLWLTENITQRREKYVAQCRREIEAGKDPRPWEGFDPDVRMAYRARV